MQLSDDMDVAQGPIGTEQEAPRRTRVRPPPIGLRVLRAVLLGFITQYVVIALCVGLTVATTLHYYVTPYVVANFEAIARALAQPH